MKRPVLLGTSALLALAALASPGASAKPAHHDRCVPRAHEEVRARSNAAVILLRRTRVLIGCSTATGRRRVIDTAYGYWIFFEQVHVRGTVVAYVITQGSKYQDSTSELYRNDALRAGRRWEIEDSWASDVAIGPRGTIAYVTDGGPLVVLRVHRPNGARLDVDGALHLRDVRFIGDRLAWRHGKTTQSADVTPTDHCGGHSGTLTLALTTHTAPSSVTACLRATGASRTFVTNDQQHSVATSGPWIATVPDDATIVTANLASNAGETVPAPGVDSFLAINANGTVAWTTRSAEPGTNQFLVHDTTGTRVLDTADSLTSIGFDGTILRYGPKTAQLPR